MPTLMKLMELFTLGKSLLHYTRTPVSMEAINSNKAANKNKHDAPSATSGRTVSSKQCTKLGMFLLFAAKYDKICAMTISFVR